MPRSYMVAVVALLIGAFIGWTARYFPSDRPDGIQWKFNEAAGRGDVDEMKKLMAAGADPLAIPISANGAVTGQTALLVRSNS